ncbi:non-homologous end-joining factor 1 [Trichomycterus rosablanca]|uniref:non-homologous end-joining factor 1 n=1 Tax=Trichomycterus rosablanca TaxID=2290929 RepID=UPI002F34FEC7
MESSGADVAVSAIPWVPVNIGGSKLLAKAWFGDTEYRVLMSDLNNIWEEDMNTERIQSRAKDLNKRLRAPVQVFFARLHSLALPCLSGQTEFQSTAAHFTLEHQAFHLNIKLKSELEGLPFYWEFHCTLSSVEVMSRELVRPLLSVTQVLQKQVRELCALLQRKDAELQDYKDNGAILSRGRLQTEPFVEETFSENFTQRLTKLDKIQDNLEFDSELQKLYVAVNTTRNTQKRKCTDEDSSASANSTSCVNKQNKADQDHNSNVLTGTRPASQSSNQNDVQQLLEETKIMSSKKIVPLITGAVAAAVPAERSAVRSKKKKAEGLFR